MSRYNLHPCFRAAPYQGAQKDSRGIITTYTKSNGPQTEAIIRLYSLWILAFSHFRIFAFLFFEKSCWGSWGFKKIFFLHLPIFTA